MSDLEARVFAAFQVEYPEHLEHLRGTLQELAVGQHPDLDKALRHAHNLKGAARAVDLFYVEKLAHRMESVFAQAERGTLLLTADACPLLHQALDSMEDSILAKAGGHPPHEPAAPLEALDAFLSARPAAPPPAAPTPEPAVVDTGIPKAEEEIATGVPARSGGVSEDTMRVSATRVDRLLGLAAQLSSEGLRQELLLSEVTALRASVEEVSREWHRASRSALARGRLDAHLQALAKDVRRVHRLQVESLWAVRRHSRHLHDDVRRILLVPARTVFEGFSRLMRDLARDLGKELDFSMHGVDVQADRRVLQSLKDPVLHLLRNAASHGIESAPERSAAGKPERGQVILRMQTRGSRLTVYIEDDGRGIDFPQVARTAVKLGLLSETEATVASPLSLGRMLFLPGFSTLPTVTEVSGRGIGLSVVQEAMGRLRGEAEVEPRPGGGVVFILTVPLSLSMQTLLLVHVQGQTLGLPLPGIECMVRIKADEVHTIEGRSTITVAGAPVALWSLSHLLYRDSTPPPLLDGHLSVVVLRAGAARLGVAVDAFAGKIDGVLQSLGPVQPAGLKASAGLVLGTGEVCLVLNPSDVLDLARDALPPLLPVHEAAPRVAVESAAHRPRALPWVLVVDDSFTTRTLEKGILEASGYQVRVAVDGIEALHILRSDPCDLVIADVQMPRMDGFELLAAIKNDPRLGRLPVIMVTSLESREDQERGLSLGADAYIVKRRFEQRDLLETVRQLL